MKDLIADHFLTTLFFNNKPVVTQHFHTKQKDNFPKFVIS